MQQQQQQLLQQQLAAASTRWQIHSFIGADLARAAARAPRTAPPRAQAVPLPHHYHHPMRSPIEGGGRASEERE